MKGSGAGTILPGRLEGVHFAIKDQALIHGIDLSFEAGPLTIILGPNGAGKSLTLRLAHGLIAPTAGRVVWQRKNASDQQAMVFQRPVMLRRSAIGNIDFALRLRGLAKAERLARCQRMLGLTGLTRLAERPARVLSAGEQHRLALARAWAVKPEILFLDEPTANLDPAATRAVEEIVQAIHATGVKVVMTTHDLGQARRLGDEVVFLHRGRLIERTAAKAFFERPDSEEARAFLKGELIW